MVYFSFYLMLVRTCPTVPASFSLVAFQFHAHFTQISQSKYLAYLTSFMMMFETGSRSEVDLEVELDCVYTEREEREEMTLN